jgi:hypothetical protein
MQDLMRCVFVLLAMCTALAVGGQFAVAEPATATDVQLAKTRLEALGKRASYRLDDAGKMAEITIEDGAELTADDIALFGRLGDLRALRIQNCRALDDAMVGRLTGLGKLDTLVLTNSAITDAGVQTIVQSFPELVELDRCGPEDDRRPRKTRTALAAPESLQRSQHAATLQDAPAPVARPAGQHGGRRHDAGGGRQAAAAHRPEAP